MTEAIAIAGFYAARPTLEIEGRAVPALSDGIRALLVEEDASGLYRAEISVENWGAKDGSVDYLYFDRGDVDFGHRIAITIGSGDAEARVFEGRIMALEAHYPEGAPPQLVILAEDRLQDLRMTRRTRTFEDVSDADVFRTIASDHGLSADVELEGPTHRVLAQLNQSDLAFLRSRAQAVGAELWVEQDRLQAKPRSARGDDVIELVYRRRLLQFSALADLATQRSSLSVTGWDVSSKSKIEESATSAVLGSELGEDEAGGDLVRSVLGEREERIVHTVPFSSDEAQAMAKARYRAVSRRFVTGRALAEGDGRIRAGARVRLAGLGGLFDGDYSVAAVRHEYGLEAGLRTRFVVERPGIGRV